MNIFYICGFIGFIFYSFWMYNLGKKSERAKQEKFKELLKNEVNKTNPVKSNTDLLDRLRK